jgi:hypothetical protein
LAEMLRLHDVGRRLALISLDENWTPQPLPGIVVYNAHEPQINPDPVVSQDEEMIPAIVE